MSGEFGRVVVWKYHPSQRRRGSGVSSSNLWSLQNRTNYREGILRAASVWQKTGTLVSHSAKPEKKSSSEVHTNNNTPRTRARLPHAQKTRCLSFCAAHSSPYPNRARGSFQAPLSAQREMRFVLSPTPSSAVRSLRESSKVNLEDGESREDLLVRDCFVFSC